MSFIKKRIQSFRHAFRGIGTLIGQTPNMRIHLIAAIAAITLGFVFRISKVEWLTVITVTALVFVMEAINSSLETLSDYASKKETHPAIRKVKDIAAAGVLFAALAALIAELMIFLPKIF